MTSDATTGGEARLRDAEFRAVAETAPDAIITADAGNQIAYFNPAAERMFALSAAAALGRPLDILIPERLRAAHRAGLDRFVSTGKGALVGTTVEVIGLDAHGREFPVELSLGTTGAGAERMFTAVIRDVTERKRRERHLAAQLAVTRALASAGSAAETGEMIVQELAQELGCDVGMLWTEDRGRLTVRHAWQADPTTTASLVDASTALTFGPGEGVPGAVAASGRPHWIEDAPQAPAFRRREAAVAAGVRSGIWLPLPSEHGVIGVIELFARVVVPVDDALRDLLMTVASQVGEHVRRLEAQEALDEARTRFASAFTHAPTGMALVAADGRWLEVNPALCRLTGYDADHLLTMRFDDITHPEDLAADRALVAQTLAGDIDSYDLEKRYVRASGEAFWARLSVSIVRHPRAPYFISHIQDVSAAHEAVELRERTAEVLRRSNVELERFAQIAAHDLRTPLLTITGFAGLLLRSGDLPEAAREQIGMIRDSARNADALLGHLLTYARATSGEPGREPLDPRAVVEDVLQTLHAEIDRRGADVRAGDLPPVVANRIQLAQIVQNLVGNAIKFTPEDRRPIVTVDAERDGDVVRFTITDNAIGVDPTEADALFTMFRRGARSRKFAGSGIGLAVCAKIVADHGGQLWVEPSDGDGSRFRFTLPAVPAPDASG